MWCWIDGFCGGRRGAFACQNDGSCFDEYRADPSRQLGGGSPSVVGAMTPPLLVRLTSIATNASPASMIGVDRRWRDDPLGWLDDPPFIGSMTPSIGEVTPLDWRDDRPSSCRSLAWKRTHGSRKGGIDVHSSWRDDLVSWRDDPLGVGRSPRRLVQPVWDPRSLRRRIEVWNIEERIERTNLGFMKRRLIFA